MHLKEFSGHGLSSQISVLANAMQKLKRYEFRQNHSEWIDSVKPTLDPASSREVSDPMGLADFEVENCHIIRSEMRSAICSLLKDDGILVIPTFINPPSKLGAKEILSEDYLIRMSALSSLASMSGCCEVALPVIPYENSPVSVSLMAEHGDDRFLLDVAGEVDIFLKRTAEEVSKRKASFWDLPAILLSDGDDTRGRIAFLEKDLQKAVECHTKAIKINGSNASYYHNRAKAYLEMQSYPQVEADCTMAIELDEKGIVHFAKNKYYHSVNRPESAQVYMLRGTARKFLHNCDGAKQDFRHALSLDPTNYREHISKALEEIDGLDGFICRLLCRERDVLAKCAYEELEEIIYFGAVVDFSGNWRLHDDLQTSIPMNRVDTRIWSESANGLFSCLQSAYKRLKKHYSEVTPTPVSRWKWRWHFLWLAAQERLIADYLFKKIGNITLDAACTMCSGDKEKVIHLLRHCTHARRIWEQLLPVSQRLWFDSIYDYGWFKTNLCDKLTRSEVLPNVPWYLIFTATVWNLWKARNRKVFNNKLQPLQQTLFLIRKESLELNSSFNGGAVGGVWWKLPPLGWVKLNTDGSTRAQSNQGAMGGLLRNDRGEWLWGFCDFIPSPTVDEAKLHALLCGLRLAWERRVAKIEIEVDSENIWNMVKGNSVTPPQLQDKVHECQELLRMPWEAKFILIQRIGNDCAGKMASLCYTLKADGGFLDCPPAEIAPFLAFDLA